MNVSLNLARGAGLGDWLVIDGLTIRLKPGDYLLYGAHDFTGWLTGLKTFSPAVHVEVYAGNGQSVASRNGLGVDMYDFRPGQLIAVLRPNQPFDFAAAMAWFNQPYRADVVEGVRGRPYGWLDLLRFFNICVKNSPGWICSQFGTLLGNAGAFNPFAKQYASGTIDPGDYFVSPCFDWVWVEAKARKAVGKM